MSSITLLPACSAVSVNKQDAAKTISSARGNIVTDNTLSRHTTSVLLSAGLNERACMRHFDLCLAQLSDSLLNHHYRGALAAFAELHYAKARDLAASEGCQFALERAPINPYYANAPLSEAQEKDKQKKIKTCLNSYQTQLFDAIKTSYTYLFYDELEHDFEDQAKSAPTPQKSRIATGLDIQTQDIYNSASNDVIVQLYQSSSDRPQKLGFDHHNTTYLPVTAANSDQATIANVSNNGRPTDQIQVMSIDVDRQTLNIYLPNEQNYLQNAQKKAAALADLTSTYELRLSGLNTVSQRDGIGVSLVASLDDRYTTTIQKLLATSLSGRLATSTEPESDGEDSSPTSRIYPTGHLLMTGLVIPKGNSVLDVLGARQLDIHLYNPYRSESVDILGSSYPLAANFSAGYGLWLAENQLDGVGYLSLLSREPEARLPKLFMLEPYDPDKRVIIMLHGLASSPATWVNLTNNIFNDDELRDNYQVWQIFYPTNLPILENRYQIQKLIHAAYKNTDPKGNHRASSGSVIISHSMGAVIARMMLSDDDLGDKLGELEDQNLLTDANRRQIDRTLKQAFGKDKLAKRFELNALEQVDTAVFLSAPFRGTDYADRWFTRALRRIIYLPISVVKTVTDNLATIATTGDLAHNPLGALYLQNGASQLSDKSSFIRLTRDININDRITFHSIIANSDSDITKGLAQMQPEGALIDLSVPDERVSSDSRDDANRPATKTNTSTTPLFAAVTVDNAISQSLTERLSDGIVPYTSAHLDGAASETIINAGHNVQDNPQTILTLRKILHQNLQNP